MQLSGMLAGLGRATYIYERQLMALLHYFPLEMEIFRCHLHGHFRELNIQPDPTFQRLNFLPNMYMYTTERTFSKIFLPETFMLYCTCTCTCTCVYTMYLAGCQEDPRSTNSTPTQYTSLETGDMGRTKPLVVPFPPP